MHNKSIFNLNTRCSLEFLVSATVNTEDDNTISLSKIDKQRKYTSKWQFITEPTARSAVPGVSTGRGLLIVHREVQSRCPWQLGSQVIRFWYVMTSLSLISILWRTIVQNSFDWLTRLFCSFPNHDTTLTVILKPRLHDNSFGHGTLKFQARGPLNLARHS